MDEEANTEYCSNCKRDIPASNYVMHATHCQRNLTLCKECGEPVPISQQEEHFEENHAQVKCECGELVEKMNMESHKEQDCQRRSVSCQFCDLELPFSEMDPHIVYCGSRTEKCEECDKYVQLKDLDEHVSSGCRFPVKEEKRVFPNPQGDSVSQGQADMLLPSRFGEYSGYSPYYTTYYRDSYNSSDMREFKRIMETGLGTPPISDPMDGFGFIDNHTFAPDVNEYSVFNNGITSRGPPQSAASKTEYDPYDGYHVDGRYGEFGQDYVGDEELQAAEYPVDDYIDEHRGEVIKNMGGIIHESLPTIRSAVIADDTEADEAMLPCEFCGGLFPMDALVLHQSGCQLNSPSSTLRFAFTPMSYHQRRTVPPLTSPPAPRPRQHSPSIEQENTVDDDTEGETQTRDDLDHNDTFLPCEFCQVLLPAYSLIHHQAICDAAPFSRPPSGIPDKSRPVEQYLNNQRPVLGNARKPRPIRPVFSEEPTNPYDDYIPGELDDSDPFHDSPSIGADFVNGIKENPRRKISDSERYTDSDSPPLNNSQYSVRSGDYSPFPAQVTIRNNDLSKKRSIPELPPISKATIKQNGRREPEFSSAGKQHGGSISKEQRYNAEKSDLGAVAKQTAETRKLANISGTTGRSGIIQQGSLSNDYARRVNRDHADQRTKIGAHQSVNHKSDKIPQSTDIQIGSSGPTCRRDMSRSGGEAVRSSRVNLAHSLSDVQISGISNPRRNPTTKSRSSGGREGISRLESDPGSTVPSKKPSKAKKKIA